MFVLELGRIGRREEFEGVPGEVGVCDPADDDEAVRSVIPQAMIRLK